MAKKTVVKAAPKPAKITASAKPRKKSELYGLIADHVGIGSDFDGVTALPVGMEDVTRLPRIAQALLDRGYSDADVKKIIGGNMLRVLETAIDPTERKR